jgi:hypothetical protein
MREHFSFRVEIRKVVSGFCRIVEFSYIQLKQLITNQ